MKKINYFDFIIHQVNKHRVSRKWSGFQLKLRHSSLMSCFLSFDDLDFLTSKQNDELYKLKWVATIYILENDETFLKCLLEP